ncbi:class I tRNA ligase family protein [Streptomyces sp. ISL-100]|uniref:class I tRNA ligase family protein n=1 Tax=Streptomyces sp. ISL-100 TaxID=2819173 RepID=UPI001BE9102A|nr:class I tRNA ligase family protein [Streptomyces sp. ISL-100]MBT2396905.1 class I tRNA ligase family protein [Streptomyces sp. ISL-100]
MSTGTGRPVILIAATPTPNGDLHVGHLAGPYLSADIYARRQRALGRQVTLTTCTDDSQSYVVASARRNGTTPAELVAGATSAIEKSLYAMGISMDGLPPIDDNYRATVLEFVQRLHDDGRLRLRTVQLPYAETTGQFLYDGLVGGECPVCLVPSSAGACEGCGHPNNFTDLLRPYNVLNPDEPVSHRECVIWVLPAEEYRASIEEHFDRVSPLWRPPAAQLVREIMARPLPDIPITVPGEWGIEAPFAETPGQILYPWIEAMPASMYATWWAAGQQGDRREETDAHWRADTGAELVYFHGFDNVFHWGLLDLVMLLAHGDRYITPASNVCNQFYELDHAKFSTSRRHLINSTELLRDAPRDVARFFLALTAPEYQRTNFDARNFRALVDERLTTPWNRLAVALDTLTAAAGRAAAETPLETSPEGRRRAAAVAERFTVAYALPTFSPAMAADIVVQQVARLLMVAEAAVAGADEEGAYAGLGDLLAQVAAVLTGGAPILVDAADQARDQGLALDPAAAPPETIAAFALPRLD